jgi:hypothetical protein
MNAMAPQTFITEAKGWATNTTAAHLWRGGAIDQFTQAETQISETLLLLSLHPECGAKVALRHLNGQRLDDLMAALGETGPFHTEGKALAKALTRYKSYESLRNFLCHGLMTLTIDRTGKWWGVFKLINFKAGKVEHGVLVVDESEALTLLQDLTKCIQSLTSHATNLRKAFPGLKD